ncbi:MAG: FecR family protein [Flavobacteriaceae bacterium]|nr:FecR family protein [Flavobacteriaceae bacterium]
MKDNYFLAKWLNNELSEDDLKHHLSEGEIHSYKKIISATEKLEPPVFNPEESLETLETFKLLGTKPLITKLSFTYYLYRVAAVFIIFFTSYYFISNKSTSYTTSFAEKINITLPDNSKVQLNAASELDLKKRNWGENRELKLKGEAFFDVSKGSTFKVKTTLGTVSVLGTQFNVIVRDHYFEVHCYEGTVSVDFQKQTTKLTSGSSFKLLNSEVTVNHNSTRTTPLWIQNISSFDSMPYKYVIEELERQYNVVVEYDVNIFSNTIFTGNFTHTDLEMALQTISIPLNLKYTIYNNKVSLQNQ